ncbi:porin family protein [Algibacter mikhailovii]|uniref:porin family protein n=1 Tax=Algibacter mikhailovii TaxID=425498 RepID=UPI002493EA11|nr:porin family protein [Algibacter mikhailovii]
MKYVFIVFCYLIGVTLCTAQEETIKEVDSLYREDQFYAGISYNILINKPIGVTQSGFSFGFNFGFIRDMPINKTRNLAFGIGLGYSTSGYNQNILMTRGEDNNFNYTLLDDSQTYSRNKFNTHVIEVPIEFRWRTSTPVDYDFWRIYAGFKVGYLVSNVTRYKGDLGDIKQHNNSDFNDFQYGLTLRAGYGTWNFNVYYGLTPLLSDKAQLNGSPIKMNDIKVGLVFFIL